MTHITPELLSRISAKHFYENKYGNLKDNYKYFNNLKRVDAVQELVSKESCVEIEHVDPESSRKFHLEEISNKQSKELIDAYKEFNKKGFFDNWFIQGAVFIVLHQVFYVVSLLSIPIVEVSQIIKLFLKFFL